MKNAIAKLNVTDLVAAPRAERDVLQRDPRAALQEIIRRAERVRFVAEKAVAQLRACAETIDEHTAETEFWADALSSSAIGLNDAERELGEWFGPALMWDTRNAPDVKP